MRCTRRPAAILPAMLPVLLLATPSVSPGQVDRTQRAAEQPLSGAARTALLQQIEQRMAKVRTVVAQFAQEKHLALFGDVVKTQGCILYARPDQLRWEIQQPFRSILIVAGRAVAKFEFQDGQRRRLELGRSGDIILMVMDQIRSWFRGDFSGSVLRYDLRVFAAAGERPARIELLPKDEQVRRNLQRIELRIAKDLASIERVTIFERGADKTVMRFVPLGDNPALAAAYFDLLDPRAFDPAPFRKPTSRPKLEPPKSDSPKSDSPKSDPPRPDPPKPPPPERKPPR